MANPIRVLICDDSALVRQILLSIFEDDPQIEVVGTASNPLIARSKIKELNPDVLTLDIEMPEMDGLSFLEKIMTLRPMPVVMISSLTQKGTAQTLRALELGVCDVVGKPTQDLQKNFQAIGQDILRKVKVAATAKVRALDNLKPSLSSKSGAASKVDLIAIGASTGGVVALKEVIPLLPVDSPPVLIVQHMPEAYTAGFAERLNAASRLEVVETQDGMQLETGRVYLAHGGYHLRIKKKVGGYILSHGTDDPVSGHKPSVDALFMSVAEIHEGNTLGVILTGMGRDGAKGLLAMRKGGSLTIGQNESTCVVYGMPRVAMEVGAVEKEVALSKIASAITEACWPSYR